MDAGGSGWSVAASCSLLSTSRPTIAVLRWLLPLVWPSYLVLRLAAVVQADRVWGRGGSVRSEQPAGEAERCPAWCAVNHDVASDELDGVVHESAHLPVAGVVPQREHDADDVPVRQAATAELYLVRYQYAGEADEWLYLGDGHHGLDVSPETAQRLKRAIGRVMDSEVERN